MNEPINTRIRDTKFNKEGVILAYTSKGVMVVEWNNGSVSAFEGEYAVVDAHLAEKWDVFRGFLNPDMLPEDAKHIKNPHK